MNFNCNCNNPEKIKSGIKKVLMIIGFTIMGAGLVVLMGFVVMWLWNWLMPLIFNLPTLTYWQAAGVFILAKIIFGGFGGDSSGNSKSGKSPKKEIKEEVSREFGKEFDKEFDKEFGKYSESNKDYDDLYEKWWEEKGESSFKEYMSKDDDKEI